jgi:hypothetical protein
MGLYSTVLSCYEPLGPEFQGALQTKELTSLMDEFWLAPDGKLYEIRVPLEWGPQGVRPAGRGRVKPYRKSGVVRFTAHHDGQVLESLVYFKTGQLNAVLCQGPIFSCDCVDPDSLC